MLLEPDAVAGTKIPVTVGITNGEAVPVGTATVGTMMVGVGRISRVGVAVGGVLPGKEHPVNRISANNPIRAVLVFMGKASWWLLTIIVDCI
jgi:hypothetical protein